MQHPCTGLQPPPRSHRHAAKHRVPHESGPSCRGPPPPQLLRGARVLAGAAARAVMEEVRMGEEVLCGDVCGWGWGLESGEW
eukprot:scaffold81740_cov61-Phaeocystis_antarctica.AAC.5